MNRACFVRKTESQTSERQVSGTGRWYWTPCRLRRQGRSALGSTGPWTRTPIISLDGAEHTRQRRLVSKAFTPRATARLHTTIVEVITGLVDPHTATGRCDVVADIARPCPIPIISVPLGAPRQDWQLFSDWADDFFKAFEWNVARDTPVIVRAWEALDAYLDDMIAERRHHLTDDLICELIRAEDDGERLTHDELPCSRAAC